jgi:hypothetical protein
MGIRGAFWNLWFTEKIMCVVSLNKYYSFRIPKNARVLSGILPDYSADGKIEANIT